MEMRPLGQTGLRVSVLGFGCGDVGGLMVRGEPAERRRAVERALELGINYFDTAPQYGQGLSERHLGETLREVGANVHVGTKLRLAREALRELRAAVSTSVDASLARLGRDRVDLLQVHNLILTGRGERGLTVSELVHDLVPVLQRLQQQGKIGHCGITALGDTVAVHQAVQSGDFATAQVCYNLLNPTAGVPLPLAFPGQNFDGLLDHTRAQSMGVIVIRVLAAGALSGVVDRHPVAVPTVAPIASGPDYAADVERARLLEFLVRDGLAESLVDAALRFAVSSDAVSTVLLGYSSLEQLEYAAAAVQRGPLPPLALQRLSTFWATVAARARLG
jgi:L-galactose dehydrogenase/L-glyceraldehyde 3-phosphate reductase